MLLESINNDIEVSHPDNEIWYIILYLNQVKTSLDGHMILYYGLLIDTSINLNHI